jgi:hypothetical protein
MSRNPRKRPESEYRDVNSGRDLRELLEGEPSPAATLRPLPLPGLVSTLLRRSGAMSAAKRPARGKGGVK